MIGIIVAGHGNFPTGIMSAVSLIAGNPEHIKAVDFVKGMSSQELKQKLEEQMEALGTSEILVMTDLLGGTPFNVASGIKTESEKKYQSAGRNEPGYGSGSNLLQRADGIGRTGRNYQAERKRWCGGF